MDTAVIEKVDELKMRNHLVQEQHQPQEEEVGEEDEEVIVNNDSNNECNGNVHLTPVQEGQKGEEPLEVSEPAIEYVQVKEEVIQQSSNEVGQEEGENMDEFSEVPVVVKSESGAGEIAGDLSIIIDDILDMSDEPQKVVKKDRIKDESTECKVCHKVFKGKWNLVTHMRIHTDERPYQCPVCSTGFRQFAHLSKHMAANHRHLSNVVGSNIRGLHPGIPQPPPQRMKVKNTSIDGRPALAKKVIPKFVKKGIPTHVKKFKKVIRTTPAELEDPYKNLNLRKCQVKVNRFDVDDDKPMSPSLILQKFNHMASLTQGKDLLLQLNSEGRSCVVKMDTNLLAHFLQPIPPPPPSSEGVVRVNLSGSVYQTSTSSHKVNTKKPEPIMKTVLQSGLVKDRRGRPPKGSLLFKCPKCPKRCISQDYLFVHNLRHHSGNSGYRIGFSKKKIVGVSSNTSVISCIETSTSPTLSMKIPTGKMKTNKTMSVQVENAQVSQVQGEKIRKVGSLGCTICARTFSRLDVLKKHMQLHTGEQSKNSFQCPTCLKSFMSSSYLVFHMRTHTGERPYECQECKKRFSRSDTLKNHSRLHTGERPHACPNCEERFSQFSGLKVHIKKHHSGETASYRCAVCSALFFDKASLTAHSACH